MCDVLLIVHLWSSGRGWIDDAFVIINAENENNSGLVQKAFDECASHNKKFVLWWWIASDDLFQHRYLLLMTLVFWIIIVTNNWICQTQIIVCRSSCCNAFFLDIFLRLWKDQDCVLYSLSPTAHDWICWCSHLCHQKE